MHLVFCPVQGKVMTVQPLLCISEGLFHIAIPLQQLVYKDVHLVFEAFKGPPLILHYPF